MGIWLAWEGGRVVCYDEKNQPIVTRTVLKKEKQTAQAHSEEMAKLAEEAILARRETENRLAEIAAKLAQLQALVKQMGGST